MTSPLERASGALYGQQAQAIHETAFGEQAAANWEEPLMRSPAYRQQRALGARFEVGDGWEVAADYGDPGSERKAIADAVAVVDVTARGKVDLRGSLARLLGHMALELAPGRLAESSGEPRSLFARIGESWAVAFCPPPATALLLDRLQETVDPGAMVTDVSCLLVGFALAGPRADELVRRLSSFDISRLGAGECAAVRLARVWALLLRRPFSIPVTEVYVSSEYGRYVWETLLEKGASLGVKPAGMQALCTLGWW